MFRPINEKNIDIDETSVYCENKTLPRTICPDISPKNTLINLVLMVSNY